MPNSILLWSQKVINVLFKGIAFVLLRSLLRPRGLQKLPLPLSPSLPLPFFISLSLSPALPPPPSLFSLRPISLALPSSLSLYFFISLPVFLLLSSTKLPLMEP